ncbi:beta-lactamase/transpeptidase-like protein [Macrophomina phaseolina]|uniref:Beta-lactamase/transpeptidase-like protein n=1 Tax=Macrophomina phaseolina TaxID=35725 RepID=A0ABQ8GCH3_9PEZI|nr:beta-lactamase/transpeptidase-like protein [Macrophomina phaseolina]
MGCQVHASSPEKAYVFNHGLLKFNETSRNDTTGQNSNQVNSDSIFRVLSISKSIATLSALMVESESRAQDTLPVLSIDSPVRQALPQFGLPEVDWQNGGSEITLSMLASHSSGLPREGYSTDFNMVSGLARANTVTIGAKWASTTPEQIIEHVKQRNLMFAPGQRAAYSNAGISILASAAVNYHNQLANTNLSWSEYANQEILGRLNMTHSFFGTIPDDLTNSITVPGGENWADLVLSLGYDPAAGMWSSTNDITKLLHAVWLARSPQLITPTQRRTSLQPRLALPDGKQQSGVGWEIAVIDTTTLPTNSSPSALPPRVSLYGKSGDGGGYHSWLDVVPTHGYGTVILAQESAPAGPNYTRITPTIVRDSVHALVLPALARAYAERLRERYAGMYGVPRDDGVIGEDVATKAASNGNESFARLEVEGGVLFLRELVVNGTSALEGLDRLGWTAESQSRFFSEKAGVSLNPAEGAGENEAFGAGAQVWRAIPELETCDWYDFDGYTDQNGWPLSKLVLVETDGGVELHYPPYDTVLTRQ